ncbi:unnamed protein product [Acanthoscelides obtectus]|uniref:Uncharacterized protein n=1 Tax=Acanthoscelides obtectus TaxID=200917 RepID=A0A9P0L265_ACAOB|nr:unnamed protein product [Acanthoscelides obtectus]CAK1659403.1 hypothetical protein AOBTE_LOCUS21439 [Acanthoscelides obtectus]
MLSPLRHVTNVISFAGKSTTFRMALPKLISVRLEARKRTLHFQRHMLGG